jgi:hypothetical protein
LVYFSEPKDNEALRAMGKLLYEMALECWRHWPDQPEGWLRSNLRAAVADLRHSQGHLATIGGDPPDDPYGAALCRTAVRLSREVGKVAEALEKTLGTWRGEEVS